MVVSLRLILGVRARVQVGGIYVMGMCTHRGYGYPSDIYRDLARLPPFQKQSGKPNSVVIVLETRNADPSLSFGRQCARDATCKPGLLPRRFRLVLV